jgi:alpha-beta hydrolase superfamily lysophospholipase
VTDPHGWHELIPPRAKAGLVIVHGIAEHGARYRHVATALARHDGADQVCPPSGSRSVIDRLGSLDKQLITFPQLLHEVHNENEASREALFKLMSGWMLERPGVAAGWPIPHSGT